MFLVRCVFAFTPVLLVLCLAVAYNPLNCADGTIQFSNDKKKTIAPNKAESHIVGHPADDVDIARILFEPHTSSSCRQTLKHRFMLEYCGKVMLDTEASGQLLGKGDRLVARCCDLSPVNITLINYSPTSFFASNCNLGYTVTLHHEVCDEDAATAAVCILSFIGALATAFAYARLTDPAPEEKSADEDPAGLAEASPQRLRD